MILLGRKSFFRLKFQPKFLGNVSWFSSNAEDMCRSEIFFRPLFEIRMGKSCNIKRVKSLLKLALHASKS